MVQCWYPIQFFSTNMAANAEKRTYYASIFVFDIANVAEFDTRTDINN